MVKTPRVFFFVVYEESILASTPVAVFTEEKTALDWIVAVPADTYRVRGVPADRTAINVENGEVHLLSREARSFEHIPLRVYGSLTEARVAAMAQLSNMDTISTLPLNPRDLAPRVVATQVVMTLGGKMIETAPLTAVTLDGMEQIDLNTDPIILGGGLVGLTVKTTSREEALQVAAIARKAIIERLRHSGEIDRYE